MLKQTILAAFSIAALTVIPAPVVTSAAMAQHFAAAPCTNTPNCPGGGSGDTYRCSDQLGYLRRVYREQLEVIDDPALVAVVPICMEEDYGVMRSEGNAGALRQAIARNDAMMDALFLKNFGPDDVVGIRMTGEESLILYVHPFHHY